MNAIERGAPYINVRALVCASAGALALSALNHDGCKMERVIILAWIKMWGVACG